MLILISPAKSLDFESADPAQQHSTVAFPDETTILVKYMQGLSQEDLRQMMDLSDKLAALNYERYQTWAFDTLPTQSKSALFAFQGDVYQGLEAANFDAQSLEFAQKHLRILSGLYGILKPFDRIQAYRLEMGTSLGMPQAKTLYDFWGEKITRNINQELKTHINPTLINLASQEYFKAVKPAQIEGKILHIHFKELKGDKYKVVSFYAKKARGLMSAFIIKNQLTEPEQLKAFDEEAYQFNASLSDSENWYFTR